MARFVQDLPADGGFGDRVTITDLLHRAGYATGHFGKWHIGPEESAKAGTYGIDVVRSEHGRMKKDGMRGRDARIYDDAIRFIEQHREQPFYINVWSHISHYRIDPPESYVARFADLKVDPHCSPNLCERSSLLVVRRVVTSICTCVDT